MTPRAEPSEAMVQIAESRVAQEVQAAMVIARKFPRDQTAAFARIIQACKRPGLAEAAMYAYPRGGQTVTGPSIRLAEALAQAWGNLDFGIIEVEQRGGESTVMSYAWDLETNVRQTKVFTVKHARYTKTKGAVSLPAPRDVYEMTANQGARRLRACVLGVIPGDVIESAVARCAKTLAEESNVPLVDRIRQMAAAFADLGVSVEMLEANLGHKLSTTSETELVKLRAIFRSITDNMSSASQFFGEAAKAPEKAAKKPEPMKKSNVREGEGEAPGKRKTKEPEADEEAALDEAARTATDDLGLEEFTADDPKPAPKKLSGAKLGRIHMAFRRLGVEDETRIAFLQKVYSVGSSKDLAVDQADELIRTLEEGLEDDDSMVACREWIATQTE
jgi:hypothetical protein